MKTFKYFLFIRTKQGQEFNVGAYTIEAKNVDIAHSIFNKKELPFHHFATVQSVTNEN